VIVESMKTELAVHAPAAGAVLEVFRGKGAAVAAGDALLAISAGRKKNK
jgi:biotin carboxyl carrier protein